VATPYYADEHVTLYLGDCREVTEWLAGDVLVTDPPYGIGWQAGQMFNDGRRAGGARIAGDESTQIRDEVLTLWGDGKPAVIFGSWRQPRPPKVTHRLIWHKRRTPPGLRTAAFYPAEEEVYLIGSGWVGKPMQNVIATSELRQFKDGFVARSGHPTPKPESLMEVLISKCPPGVIADPFAGSGSTLVAARNLGRRAIGVEIEERYCEVAARRLAQGVLLIS
jgi:DNA methylase